jgi:Raf kinase inhibitor-like YbhB/YbcL family protein
MMAADVGRAADFMLTSPTFDEGGTLTNEEVFNGFGCSGENVSPALAWSGAPDGTASYALTLYDPDAPTGSGWWHWVAYNIPATVTDLPAGAGAADGSALPTGAAQGNTDFGARGYGGPCPPEGDDPHHYIFTVFALDVAQLDLPENATAALVGFNLNGHALGRATLTGLYGR